ncbi:GNAT family N-acetyltransferase [Halobacillus fulvus]|nr:GNAT family N-acetyltransferase [Halobacillus fulvus]
MIELRKMDDEEYKDYLRSAIRNYAEEHTKAGTWKADEALGEAEKQYEELLPNGLDTDNHHLYTIYHQNEAVGVIWLAGKADNKGFIYDFNIEEAYQGHGYGKQAMKKIETVARDLGLRSIKLNVFAHNEVARSLYEKAGYVETNIKMEKTL